MPNIEAIRKRLEACPIPEGAVADWKDTRHFEIQTPYGTALEFWWLEAEAWQLAMLPHVEGSDECQERCGAVLDYAVAYRADVTALLAAIEEADVEALQAASEYAKDEAYRDCARLQCPECRKSTPTYVYASRITHRTAAGETLCDATEIRKHRPQAFEKP